MNFFRPLTADEAAAERVRREGAYQQGRRDAQANVAQPVLLQGDKALRQAYERGRRDERAHLRRGSPVLTTVLVLAAAAGLFVVYLGVTEGSFGRGGQLVDQNIANATASAMGVVHNGADRAGDALTNAGQELKRTAGSDD
jgi:hypothetical protein